MTSNGVALVTGANRGLGKETGRQLARGGWTVVLGSRDTGRGAEAARELATAGEVVPIPLDVTDPAGVRAAATWLERTYGRLDVLVNNAGVTADALALDTKAAELRHVFEVNVFGVVTVIHETLPLLRRSPAPRIVNVSSTTASLGLTSEGHDLPGDAERRLAYASSKAALNMLTVQYARAFGRDPALAHVKINAASPGYTATDMNGHRGTRTVAEGARALVALALLPDDGPTGRFFDDRGPLPW
ncbi:SDR family oxidoreductase [Streptomyces hoynatensis]|uniref:SDR family oxidoreductase n=1 Tax=Streptomyces hoynatensis TaxID=1141874 RepID=A0A3A9Z8W1_9ACTN|nr:SDR family oxidoreductase [Streptomyces hoynatensis]RKN44912.1 SDR family oxidoreductase [Streptomyces hoynatensis]